MEGKIAELRTLIEPDLQVVQKDPDTRSLTKLIILWFMVRCISPNVAPFVGNAFNLVLIFYCCYGAVAVASGSVVHTWGKIKLDSLLSGMENVRIGPSAQEWGSKDAKLGPKQKSSNQGHSLLWFLLQVMLWHHHSIQWIINFFAECWNCKIILRRMTKLFRNGAQTAVWADISGLGILMSIRHIRSYSTLSSGELSPQFVMPGSF